MCIRVCIRVCPSSHVWRLKEDVSYLLSDSQLHSLETDSLTEPNTRGLFLFLTWALGFPTQIPRPVLQASFPTEPSHQSLLFFSLFETVSLRSSECFGAHCVAEAGFELLVILDPSPLECWGDRCEPPGPPFLSSIPSSDPSLS